jgi:hypothetical protein
MWIDSGAFLVAFAIYPHVQRKNVDRLNLPFELFTGMVQIGTVPDEDSPDAPPAPDRAAQMKAARDAVLDAMKEWEAASYRRGFDEGWKACNDGWLKMLNEATQKREAAATEVPAEVPNGEFGGESRVSQARASDVVLNIIKERPGLRGIEIVKATGGAGPAIHERTVRTALHRMKRDKLIKVLDGRWYAADHDLEGVNPGDGGENDG